jgi:hypothetical protein
MDDAWMPLQTFERLRAFPRNNWSRATIGLVPLRDGLPRRAVSQRLRAGANHHLFAFIVHGRAALGIAHL